MTITSQKLRIEVRDYYDNPQYDIIATCNVDGTIAGTSTTGVVHCYSSFLAMVNVFTSKRMVLIVHNNI